MLDITSDNKNTIIPKSIIVISKDNIAFEQFVFFILIPPIIYIKKQKSSFYDKSSIYPSVL